MSVTAQQATVLTEITGKDRRTYSINRQQELVLEHQVSNRPQGSCNLLTGLKGGALHSILSRDMCLSYSIPLSMMPSELLR